ncbi:MAG: DUF1343 domain-containing protein [Verrucomicrobia bacterium]|nr:MAG: DUF1343 domain-containing protein [Verrucomicrobiota bacterium]
MDDGHKPLQILHMAVQLPIDHLREIWPRELRGARIGALLHPASVNSTLEHTARILEQENGNLFRLTALFGPQHGFRGETQDNMIEWHSYEHPKLHIPVYSLYGEHREPTTEMVRDLDAVLIDLQDIGARYYTFIWTMFLCMRACEGANVAVIVLDRPNPINGVTIEGPLLKPEYRSFVGMHPIPVRHGKTIGELATQFQHDVFPKCALTVLPMKNWERMMWFNDTGLSWIMASPNMPTLDTATVYPGMCLLEGTNISEGRGTTRPFEIFGAPWIDPDLIANELNRRRVPGVQCREIFFQPTFHKFASELCGGAQIHVTDRDSFQPFATGIEVIRCIRRMYANYFQWKQPPYEYEYQRLPIEVLLGGPVAEFFPD